MRTLARCALPLVVALACGACPSGASRSIDLGGQTTDLAPSCVVTPTSHLELLNACTNAESFDKQPFYPTLAPDGELPPLP